MDLDPLAMAVLDIWPFDIWSFDIWLFDIWPLDIEPLDAEPDAPGAEVPEDCAKLAPARAVQRMKAAVVTVTRRSMGVLPSMVAASPRLMHSFAQIACEVTVPATETLSTGGKAIPSDDPPGVRIPSGAPVPYADASGHGGQSRDFDPPLAWRKRQHANCVFVQYL